MNVKRVEFAISLVLIPLVAVAVASFIATIAMMVSDGHWAMAALVMAAIPFSLWVNGLKGEAK